MSNPFYITQINVNNTSANPVPAFVYLQPPSIPTQFEWGSALSNGQFPVDNYIIFPNDGSANTTGYLQVCSNQDMFQLYYTPTGNPGEVSVIAQWTNTDTPYPNNQKALWTGQLSSVTTFTLSINMNVGGFNVLSLSLNAASQSA